MILEKDIGKEILDGLEYDPSDGNFLVGNGTEWVVESGNTARTSLGLGTGNSPTFAGLTIGTLSLASGSITDSNGTIDFGNETLRTDGNISSLTSSIDVSSSWGLGSPYLVITGTARTIGITGDTDLLTFTAANLLDIKGTCRMTRLLCGGVQS